MPTAGEYNCARCNRWRRSSNPRADNTTVCPVCALAERDAQRVRDTHAR